MSAKIPTPRWKATVSTGYPVVLDKGTTVAHTFTTQFFSIPLPPISTVSFTYVFTETGTYHYYSLVPCGQGVSIHMLH